jgi:hypothetical protein
MRHEIRVEIGEVDRHLRPDRRHLGKGEGVHEGLIQAPSHTADARAHPSGIHRVSEPIRVGTHEGDPPIRCGWRGERTRRREHRGQGEERQSHIDTGDRGDGERSAWRARPSHRFWSLAGYTGRDSRIAVEFGLHVVLLPRDRRSLSTRAWIRIGAHTDPSRLRVIPSTPHDDRHPPSHQTSPVAARNSTIRIPITT